MGEARGRPRATPPGRTRGFVAPLPGPGPRRHLRRRRRRGRPPFPQHALGATDRLQDERFFQSSMEILPPPFSINHGPYNASILDDNDGGGAGWPGRPGRTGGPGGVRGSPNGGSRGGGSWASWPAPAPSSRCLSSTSSTVGERWMGCWRSSRARARARSSLVIVVG